MLACLAVLADKDAGAIVAELAPALGAVVCSELPAGSLAGSGRPGASWHPGGRAGEISAGAPGSASVEAIDDPRLAIARALEIARGQGGVALAAGSHYLLQQRMNREARSELLQMMGLVAAVVAIVILVFFGLGYLFGRLFLVAASDGLPGALLRVRAIRAQGGSGRPRGSRLPRLMTLAIFGIDNDGINLALNLLILFLVVIYLALVAWVYLDARRRLEDPVLVACATVAALIPLAGPIVYSILRPPELLADARERELEIRASELRVRQLEESSCPNCEHPVERTYLRCPECRARIKDPCESCGKPVDPRWTLCPYCETPNRRAAGRLVLAAFQAPRHPAEQGSSDEPAIQRAPASAARARSQAARSAARQASAAVRRGP